MTRSVSEPRWQAAQAAELQYWRDVDVRELMRICAEKPDFLALLGDTLAGDLFAGREVLEIGCGPLGLALASFTRHKFAIKRLVKTDPLPRLAFADTKLPRESWAAPFITWVEGLAAEGEYIRTSGETLGFQGEFDTVISYNVLDHVRHPKSILENAWRALRPGGRLVVGVDCLSFVGRWRFELLTRRIHRGTVLVEAHPHSFRPSHVTALMDAAGFRDVRMFGLPSRARQWAGQHFRPAFVAVR
jgi:SAM-dependent methyltransferase